jgi:hypothetical protein
MNRYLFYGLLALGLAARTYMLADYRLVDGGEVDVYLADEGIVGLMARHIAEGESLPVFFYGQAYLGALEAYCAAVVFRVLGPSLESLRLVPFAFSLALMALVFRFTYRAYSVATARWATALVAVAPMYFLQWNLKARGGFVEHVVLVFVVMILFWRFHIEHDRRSSLGLALGFAAGVAIWVNQLAIAYLAAMGAVLLFSTRDRRGLLPLAFGLLLGAAPLLAYNVVHPLATVKALARKAIVLNRVPVEERDNAWAARGIVKRLQAIPQGAGKLGLVFGVPPGEGLERLGLSSDERSGGPLTPMRGRLWPIPALVFGLACFASRPRRGADGFEPVGSTVLLGVLTLVTVVVGYVSPRYMLPVYPLAAVMAAVLLTRLAGRGRGWMLVGVAAVLVFNAAGWLDAVATRGETGRERTDGQALLDHLRSLGVDRCYSAGPLYHLVFVSEETVRIAPLQKNRHPAYDDDIEAAQRICYVFRDDQARKRQHVRWVDSLETAGVTYQSSRVGGYNVMSSFEPRAAITSALVARARGTDGSDDVP